MSYSKPESSGKTGFFTVLNGVPLSFPARFSFMQGSNWFWFRRSLLILLGTFFASAQVQYSQMSRTDLPDPSDTNAILSRLWFLLFCLLYPAIEWLTIVGFALTFDITIAKAMVLALSALKGPLWLVLSAILLPMAMQSAKTQGVIYSMIGLAPTVLWCWVTLELWLDLKRSAASPSRLT